MRTLRAQYRLLAARELGGRILWKSNKLEAQPRHAMAHFSLAVAPALLGLLDQARAAASAGLAINPSFTIRRFRNNPQSDNPIYLAARERFYEGMRLAGIPEG